MKQLLSSGGEALVDWADANMEEIRGGLNAEGAVLLRGYDSASPSVLKDMLALFGATPMEDARWSSPRSSVGEGAFTASEYPADQTIVLHSEMAYARRWPRLLLFQCKTAAATGGATTVCNIDRFSAAIDDLVEEFYEREVLYIRNFRPGVDIPWQNAFGTDDRGEVERIGAEHGLEVEWLDGGVLRTHQLAQGAVAAEDGAPLWFNQAHLFHPSRLPGATRQGLEAAFGAEGLPRNAVFGDGEAIPDETVSRVLEALVAHTETIDWMAGDVAIVDNMRWMHGRAPFTGARMVHVALGRPEASRARTALF